MAKSQLPNNSVYELALLLALLRPSPCYKPTSLMRSNIFQAILHTCLQILVSVTIIMVHLYIYPRELGTTSRTHVYWAGLTYG
jgi:hypothetical protein